MGTQNNKREMVKQHTAPTKRSRMDGSQTEIVNYIGQPVAVPHTKQQLGQIQDRDDAYIEQPTAALDKTTPQRMKCVTGDAPKYVLDNASNCELHRTKSSLSIGAVKERHNKCVHGLHGPNT